MAELATRLEARIQSRMQYNPPAGEAAIQVATELRELAEALRALRQAEFAKMQAEYWRKASEAGEAQ